MKKIKYQKKLLIKYKQDNSYTFEIIKTKKVKCIFRKPRYKTTECHTFELIPIMNLIVGAFGMNCFQNLSFLLPTGFLAIAFVSYIVIKKLSK
jgi:hypothetical protein